jgi:hypothetical protein
VDKRSALQELARRKALKRDSTAKVTALRAELFDKQLRFWDDPSTYKAALCTRRAGKTSLWSRYLVAEAIVNSSALIRCWHISRIRAKQLLWEDLKNTCRRHGIKTKANDTELSLKFENGSEIRLVGADKDKEAQKKRGDKTWVEVLLETQLFGPNLKSLYLDVIDPCLMDERKRGGGRLFMEGTPGVLCTGYWYEITGRENHAETWQSVGNAEGEGSGWSVHRWSVLDNPHMGHARDELAKLKIKRRWTDSHPTYMREWRALWVNDIEALYYRYDENRNGFTLAEVQPWGPGWQHVLGWDLGSRDDMAIVVWGWHPQHADLFEAYSWKKPGALAAEVMAQIEELDKRFNIVAKVADTGGGGRMYVEEVMSRYSQVFEPAKKTEKYEHVRLLNEDLLTRHVRIQRGSPLEEEIKALPIDPKWFEDFKAGDAETPPYEDGRYPNHCCDAALYGYRRAFHFLHEPTEEKPAKGSKEAVDRLEQALMERLEKDKLRVWWETKGEQPWT